MERERIIYLPFLLSALWLSGCGGPHWKRTQTVATGEALVVELEQRVEEGVPIELGYAHPASVDGRVIETFFRSTQYRVPTFFKKPKQHPSVAPEIAAELGDSIAVALRETGSSERVRFRTFNTEKSALFLPSTSVTQGVVFVQPAGTLNIAFDLIASIPDPEDPDPTPDWGDPTRWASSTVRVVPPAGVSFYRDGEGREHELWLTFALDSSGDGSAGMKPAGETNTEQTVVEPAASSERNIHSKPKAAKKKLTDREVLERLRFLEELFEDGTLNEEEYRKKRKELLEQGAEKKPTGS